MVSPTADSRNPLRVELIRPAVAALETQLGGPQRYLEVNATPTLVNLFVAVSNATQAVAYVYVDGKLSEPAPPEQVKADAPTFGASDIVFDEATVLNPLLVEGQVHGGVAQVFGGAVPVAVATLVALPAATSAAVNV